MGHAGTAQVRGWGTGAISLALGRGLLLLLGRLLGGLSIWLLLHLDLLGVLSRQLLGVLGLWLLLLLRGVRSLWLLLLLLRLLTGAQAVLLPQQPGNLLPLALRQRPAALPHRRRLVEELQAEETGVQSRA